MWKPELPGLRRDSPGLTQEEGAGRPAGRPEPGLTGVRVSSGGEGRETPGHVSRAKALWAPSKEMAPAMGPQGNQVPGTVALDCEPLDDKKRNVSCVSLLVCGGWFRIPSRPTGHISEWVSATQLDTTRRGTTTAPGAQTPLHLLL